MIHFNVMLIISTLIRVEFINQLFHFSFTAVVTVIVVINSLFQQAEPRASETGSAAPVDFVFINRFTVFSHQFIISAGEFVHTMQRVTHFMY